MSELLNQIIDKQTSLVHEFRDNLIVAALAQSGYDINDRHELMRFLINHNCRIEIEGNTHTFIVDGQKLFSWREIHTTEWDFEDNCAKVKCTFTVQKLKHEEKN